MRKSREPMLRVIFGNLFTLEHGTFKYEHTGTFILIS